MKLTINLPTNEINWCNFHSEFAKLQSKLLLLSIEKLNISRKDKEQILQNILNKIKENLPN